MNNLNVFSTSFGGYFSSEQIDFLRIIQCSNYQELIDFIINCEQINSLYKKEELEILLSEEFDKAKRSVFKRYQDTLIPRNSTKKEIILNALNHLGLKKDDLVNIESLYDRKESICDVVDYIKSKYPNEYAELIKKSNHFISQERDQNKDDLYDEFVLLSEELSNFDTMLVGSGRPDVVTNIYGDGIKSYTFDYYFAKRDLDFAEKNGKHIRFHSLLTKEANIKLFDGKSKDKIKEILKEYVKSTIDFINKYNSTHILSDGKPVISAIDMFNELISFEPNEKGEYENIWETKYGLTIEEICEIYQYATDKKQEGIHYLYNEPFLEDSKRREKVIETLRKIRKINPNLIDTLGTQMHITFSTSDVEIERCFEDIKQLQEKEGLRIEITEFDLSLSERELKRIIQNPEIYTSEKIYSKKEERITNISNIINNSGIRIDGLTYWSLTDKIDCNLERIRTSMLNKGEIKDINEITNSCGGLIPTNNPNYKRKEKSNKIN